MSDMQTPNLSCCSRTALHLLDMAIIPTLDLQLTPLTTSLDSRCLAADRARPIVLRMFGMIRLAHTCSCNIILDTTANEKRAILRAHTSPPLANAVHTMPYVYPIVKIQKAGMQVSLIVYPSAHGLPSFRWPLKQSYQDTDEALNRRRDRSSLWGCASKRYSSGRIHDREGWGEQRITEQMFWRWVKWPC